MVRFYRYRVIAPSTGGEQISGTRGEVIPATGGDGNIRYGSYGIIT